MSEVSTQKFTLSAQDIAELEELAKRYPNREALMLPVLWKVMDQEHWISPEAMEWVADFLKVPAAKVYEDEHTLAFIDIGPIIKGHTLVIPRAVSKSAKSGKLGRSISPFAMVPRPRTASTCV